MNEDKKNNAVISDKRLVAWYLRHGVKPKDMFVHRRTDAIMFVYDKTETADLYNLYMREQYSNNSK